MASTRPDPSTAFTSRRGRVASFDDHAGVGTVADDAGVELFFHCTRIAGGSRSISVGTVVDFEVEPGPTGLEAVALRPPG